MSTETTVSPVEETQNQSTEPTETPEVVTPEPDEKPADPAEAERSERDKAIRRMERRIDRKHAEAAEAKARVTFLEEQLRNVTPRQEEPTAPVTRVQFEQAVAERAAEVARIDRVNEQCNRVADQGRKEFPDFQASVANVSAELPLFDARGQPTSAMRVILKADNAAAVLHHLGKNPDLASELADLDPIDQAIRLADIRREMKPTRSPSSAPKPLEPVKGSAKSDEPPINDTARWIEWDMKQDQQKRKR